MSDRQALDVDRLARALRTVNPPDAEYGWQAADASGQSVNWKGWAEALALSYAEGGEVHQPGDHHRYRIECEVCGQWGTIRLSVDPDFAAEVAAVRPEEPPE